MGPVRPNPPFDPALRKLLSAELALDTLTPLAEPGRRGYRAFLDARRRQGHGTILDTLGLRDDGTFLDALGLRGCRTFLDAIEVLVCHGHFADKGEPDGRPRNGDAIIRSARKLREELGNLDAMTQIRLSLRNVSARNLQEALDAFVLAAEPKTPKRKRGARGPGHEAERVRDFLRAIGVLYRCFYAQGAPKASKIRKGLRRVVRLAGFAGYPPTAPESAAADPIYRLSLKELRPSWDSLTD